jgi:hypothetical protein
MASTEIRLIEPGDATTIAAHLSRDAEAFARWDEGPARQPAYLAPERRLDS